MTLVLGLTIDCRKANGLARKTLIGRTPGNQFAHCPMNRSATLAPRGVCMPRRVKGQRLP